MRTRNLGPTQLIDEKTKQGGIVFLRQLDLLLTERKPLTSSEGNAGVLGLQIGLSYFLLIYVEAQFLFLVSKLLDSGPEKIACYTYKE
jgi:hypothetical protein